MTTWPATLRPVAFLSAAALCLAAAGPASAGSIKGTVLYNGPPVVAKTLAVTIDQYVCGNQKPGEDLVVSAKRGIRNAVVSLQPPPPGAKWEGTPRPAQMDQLGCVYAPRVVVVPVGGTVDFLNSDRLLHNLHSVGKENPPFSRTQPKGRTISMTFGKPEIVRIDCDLHSWMRAWVVVAAHPFYSVTGSDGEFALEGVPPGRYTLQIWQESLGTVTKEVVVPESGAAAATVEMGKK
jgi:plastocyanin